MLNFPRPKQTSPSRQFHFIMQWAKMEQKIAYILLLLLIFLPFATGDIKLNV
jgi:hypothetical protein